MQHLKWSSVFIPEVHELAVSPSSAFIRLIQENKDFFLLILLESNFTKAKWLTGKTYEAHWCVLCFYILLKHTKFKWRSYVITHLWSHIYNTLGIRTITPKYLLKASKTSNYHILVFFICRGLHHQGHKLYTALLYKNVLLFVVYWVSIYWVFAKNFKDQPEVINIVQK